MKAAAQIARKDLKVGERWQLVEEDVEKEKRVVQNVSGDIRYGFGLFYFVKWGLGKWILEIGGNEGLSGTPGSRWLNSN